VPDDYADFLAAADAYTEGRYGECLPQLSAFLLRHPAAFAPYLLSAKAHAHLNQRPEAIGAPNSVGSRLLTSLTQVMETEVSGREHLLTLLGLSVDLGENHLSFGLLDLFFDLVGTHDGGALAKMTEFSCKFPDPVADANSVDSNSRLASLLAAFPNSSTLQFLDSKAQRTLRDAGHELRVSPPRLKFYSALAGC
jgi:hypothetical protein